MVDKVDHSGHRKRLKERYKNEGIDNFQIHNAIELLLFYGIPYKDTNEIAHRLINTFHTLQGVLDAPVEELVKVDGVGENTALLIHLIKDIQKLALIESNKNIKYITSVEISKQVLENLFYGITVEKLIVMCLDNSGKIISNPVVSEGTVNFSDINVRKVVEIVIRSNCSSVILSHNHPKGEPVPSSADIMFTTEIKNLLSQLNIKVKDHIIVGENSTYSMSQDEKWGIIF